MIAEAADASAAFENPLMPNARLRQIYLAMVQLRSLARALPARRDNRSTLQLEACLVSATVDLGPRDLVSDALTGPVVGFLRGTIAEKKKPALLANCGSARRLPNPLSPQERLWTALGAAAALKARTLPPSIALGEDQLAVTVAFAQNADLSAPAWNRLLSFAAAQQLPIVFVLLPAAGAKAAGGRSAKVGALSQIATQSGVPGIPVDADDAVAIYRVAQESIGHARIGGGPALMECIPFTAPRTARRPSVPDAIASLEQYMLHRRVATRAWMDREARAFERRAAAHPIASK